MAERPVFIPSNEGKLLVEEKMVSFTWHPGFALSQAQKSIAALHDAARESVDGEILEISSKSPMELGVALSAFNLSFETPKGRKLTVETAFQGSKVFEGGQQYEDLYETRSRDAKTDVRLKQSGDVIAFRFEGEEWPLEPKTAFYDWLYLQALWQNRELASQLHDYDAFTDIVFNPKKSFNCQARAAALFVSLEKRNLLKEVLRSRERYLEIIKADGASLHQPELLD